VLEKVKGHLGGELAFANTGGAALSTEIKRLFTQLGINVLEGYGLTETSPVVATEGMNSKTCVNRGMKPLLGVELFFFNELGEELPMGSEGEIGVAGPSVMLGYCKNEKATAESIINYKGKRVFMTGDMGTMTPEGHLQLTGRVKETYKLLNGKFVLPARIEEAIKLSPHISSSVMVYGNNRPFNICLLYPKYENVARTLGVPGATREELLATKKDEMMQLLLRDVELYSLRTPDIKMYEIIKKVVLLPYELSIDNGLFTQKLSMKRHEMVNVFEKEINDAYA
jgi:long-chain acyl-CoA synthetase